MSVMLWSNENVYKFTEYKRVNDEIKGSHVLQYI